MKAERNVPRTAGSPRGQPAWGASTLRGTLLLRMATLGTLEKQRRCHPLKAPCLHLAPQAGCPLGDPALSQKGTSIVKKQKERALSLPGKLPAPYNSRDFSLRFGSGRPLPRIIA